VRESDRKLGPNPYASPVPPNCHFPLPAVRRGGGPQSIHRGNVGRAGGGSSSAARRSGGSSPRGGAAEAVADSRGAAAGSGAAGGGRGGNPGHGRYGGERVHREH